MLKKILSALRLHFLIRFLEKNPSIEQFSRFAVVGVFNTGSDLLLYSFLTRILGFYYLVANPISFITITSISYFLNKRITFKDSRPHSKAQYFKFFVVTACGLLWSTLLLFVFVHFFHLHDLFGKLLAVGIVMFWNFGMNKMWTFRHVKHHVPLSDPSS